MLETQPGPQIPSLNGPEGKLWQLWRQGQRPDVRQFLASAGNLPLTQVAAVLAVDQRERWQSGEQVPAEAYLEQFPQLQKDPERALELVYGELLLREEGGEAPPLAEFQNRFPQYATRMRQQVELHRAASMYASLGPGGPVSGFTLVTDSEWGKGNSRPGFAPAPDRCRYDFLAPPQGPDELGRLGRYRVLKVLGAGGMGVVFEAEDTLLRRLVALKAMLPALASNPAGRQRFLREAQAAAAIDHPHIVTIFDLGEEGGIPFLAMSLLRGESLATRLQRRPALSLTEAVQIGTQVAEGLAAAHQRGLIHRDIKPDNIWLETTGEEKSPSLAPRPSALTPCVKLLDFGLARAAGESANLTKTGDILGTPAYLAPEQALGNRVDHRCDLFSLGCVLYQMVSRELPFKGTNAVSMVVAVTTQTPRPLAELSPGAPRALTDLVMQLLAKKPDQRPGSAQEVAEALKAVATSMTQVLEIYPAANPGKFHDQGVVPPFAPSPSRKWPLLGISLAAGVFLLLLGVGLFALVDYLGSLAEEKDKPTTGEIAALLPDRSGKQSIDESAKKPDPQEKQGPDKEKKPPPVKKQDEKPVDPPPVVPVIKPDLPDGPEIPSPPPLPPPAKGEANSPEVPIKELFRFKGSARDFACVAFRPDGKRLATGSWDGTVKTWDPATRRQLLFLTSHTAQICSLAYSPDGKRLASASQDKTVKVWNPAQGKLLFTLEGHGSLVTSVVFSPDGQRLASASGDETVKIWDLATRKELFTLRGHTSFVYSVAYSPDGTRLATGSGDGTVRLWEAATGEPLLTLPGDNSYVKSVAFSPDGKHLASGANDGTVKIWDPATGAQQQILRGHASGVQRVVYRPDGQRLVSASVDKKIKVWEPKSGKEIHSLQGHEKSVSDVAYGPDGKTLVSVSSDRTIRFWGRERKE